ncbi:MAG: hypothetical protein ACKOTD_04500, partial [Phycisphaerales bacterium]
MPLAVPAGTTQSIAIGINSAGTCMGRITAPSTGTVAAIWSPTGAITTLPNPAGNWTYSTGVAINDTGLACGFATLALVGTDPQQAWRWTQSGGYEMLPQLGGIESICRDINASGTVVGTAVTSGGGVRAVTWAPNGTITDLGVPQGATGSYGLNINDAGVVVGTSPATKAYVWRPTNGWLRLPDLGFKASAYDINNAGWIVGWVVAVDRAVAVEVGGAGCVDVDPEHDHHRVAAHGEVVAAHHDQVVVADGDGDREVVREVEAVLVDERSDIEELALGAPHRGHGLERHGVDPADDPPGVVDVVGGCLEPEVRQAQPAVRRAPHVRLGGRAGAHHDARVVDVEAIRPGRALRDAEIGDCAVGGPRHRTHAAARGDRRADPGAR